MAVVGSEEHAFEVSLISVIGRFGETPLCTGRPGSGRPMVAKPRHHRFVRMHTLRHRTWTAWETIRMPRIVRTFISGAETGEENSEKSIYATGERLRITERPAGEPLDSRWNDSTLNCLKRHSRFSIYRSDRFEFTVERHIINLRSM